MHCSYVACTFSASSEVELLAIFFGFSNGGGPKPDQTKTITSLSLQTIEEWLASNWLCLRNNKSEGLSNHVMRRT